MWICSHDKEGNGLLCVWVFFVGGKGGHVRDGWHAEERGWEAVRRT